MDYLLVIDIQKGFVKTPFEELPKEIVKVRDEYDCVIATKFLNTENSSFRRVLDWHALGEVDPNRELIPEIEELADYIIDKKGYFLAEKDLELFDGHRVYVCGVETDQCILAPCMQLFERGIDTWVLGDLCASTAGERLDKAALEILGRLIGHDRVITSQDKKHI